MHVLITGSLGLLGSACAKLWLKDGAQVIGIDNDSRRYFFGDGASVESTHDDLKGSNYTHFTADIRDEKAIDEIFGLYGTGIDAIIHTAAQPSHDWAAEHALEDFDINARGTLIMLEKTRQYCPEAKFVYISTSKVYGDFMNGSGKHYSGFDESIPVDRTMHSLFGCSKLAADIYAQEYGRYYGLNTVIFRPGCITGASHQGAEQHGFLSYLVKCVVQGIPYKIYGYDGKQVRDQIHADDLAEAIRLTISFPRGKSIVYNIGGGREINCSVLEAIALVEKLSGKKLRYEFASARKGDHMWWITDVSKFKADYPKWQMKHTLESIVKELIERWTPAAEIKNVDDGKQCL